MNSQKTLYAMIQSSQHAIKAAGLVMAKLTLDEDAGLIAVLNVRRPLAFYRITLDEYQQATSVAKRRFLVYWQIGTLKWGPDYEDLLTELLRSGRQNEGETRA